MGYGSVLEELRPDHVINSVITVTDLLLAVSSWRTTTRRRDAGFKATTTLFSGIL